MQLTGAPAGRLAVAFDRDVDSIPHGEGSRSDSPPFPKKLGARLCINEQILLARHGIALPVASRFFGTGAETLFLMALLGRIVRVGRPFALVNVKPPSVVA